MATSDLEAAWWPHSPWWMSLRIATPFSGSTQRWKTLVTLRFTSSLLIIVYAAARRCISLAAISSAGSSLLTRNLRMGWAHEGAVTSSSVNVATITRVGGLGESATASSVVVVPGPTAAVPGHGSEVPGPVRLRQSPGQLSKSPCRLRGSSSRIRLFLAQAVRRWNPTLETA